MSLNLIIFLYIFSIKYSSCWHTVNLMPNSYRNYLTQMEEILNPNENPCNDFYEFVCGKSAFNSLGVDKENALIPPYLYNLNDRYETFKKNHMNFQSVVGQKASEYFQSTLKHEIQSNFYMTSDLVNVRSRDFNNIKNLFIELDFLRAINDTWPYLRQEKYDNDDILDWFHITAKINSIGIPAIFRVTYSKNSILLEPFYDQFTQKASLKKTMLDFGVSETAADENSLEIYEFLQKLNVLRIFKNLESTTLNSSSIKWAEFGELLMHNLKLNIDEFHRNKIKMLLYDEIKLNAIYELLENTEKRIIVNYVIWKLIENVRNEEFTSVLDYFEPVIYYEKWTELVETGRLNSELKKFLYITSRLRKIYRLNLENKIRKYAKNNLSFMRVQNDFKNMIIDSNFYFSNLINIKMNMCQRILLGHYFDVNDIAITEENDNDNPTIAYYYFKQFMNFITILENRPLFHYLATDGFNMWKYKQKVQLKNFEKSLEILRNTSQSSIKYENVDQLRRHFIDMKAFNEILLDYNEWYQSEMFKFMEDYFLQFYGFQPKHIMFLAFGQVYCGRGDNHKVAINSIFQSIDEFYIAFNCNKQVSGEDI